MTKQIKNQRPAGFEPEENKAFTRRDIEKMRTLQRRLARQMKYATQSA